MILETFRRYAGVVALAALLMLGLVGLARADVPCRVRAGLNLSVGAAWSDKAYTDWVSTSGRTLADRDRISTIQIINTHATQALFLLWRANAGEATTHVEYVGPGASNTIDIWETSTQTISVQGAGAATTGKLLACWGRP